MGFHEIDKCKHLYTTHPKHFSTHPHSNDNTIMCIYVYIFGKKTKYAKNNFPKQNGVAIDCFPQDQQTGDTLMTRSMQFKCSYKPTNPQNTCILTWHIHGTYHHQTPEKVLFWGTYWWATNLHPPKGCPKHSRVILRVIPIYESDYESNIKHWM